LGSSYQTLKYSQKIILNKEEIDYIEEEGGTFSAFEIKWSKSNKKPSKVWTDAYPNSDWKVITKENFLDFI